MRFNRFLHLIAFAGKAHRGSPASGGLTTKMPDGGAPSQAMSQPDFSLYLPLSAGVAGIARALALIAAGEDINYQGAAGPVDFDENGDVVGPIEIWQVSDGAIVSTGRFETP